MESRPHPAGGTPFRRAIAVGAALALVVGIIVLAFAWPSVTAEPKDLPVAVAGPDASVAQVESRVAEQADGAVALERVDDRDAAVASIESREVYGAIILGEAPTDAPEVLVASAASPVVAQTLRAMAAELQQGIDAQVREQLPAQLSGVLQDAVRAAVQAALAQASGQAPAAPPAAPSVPEIPTVTVAVTDVVPLADTDPRGTGLTAAMFPIVIGGMLGGIAISLAVIGAMRRVAAVVVYSAVGGLLLTGILQGWFGALQGDYWVNSAAIALALAAIAAPITGLVALIGRAGIALGAVTFLLGANPISAAAIPVEFLPAPWGAVGQWFPPGAAATLLRDLSYFPSADATFPWLVLAAWATGGIVLSLVGHFRTAGGAEPDAEAAHADEAEAAPAETTDRELTPVI
ncbi:hypothetical protein ACFPER_00620 [Agromyces aurantiacus]|uniref:ABC transporter permease n=1 Tax=Agromyces aurantiacus TaxID=165814 RepID=A0ABV9R0A5_9MICO|nr:hypothetical protein [Agromyces aurantiacus]MBM7505586.1 hypothetical protein [Agromyces aurantiacus]